MKNNFSQFWSGARWILLALYGIIVSAGAINATTALNALNRLEPGTYGREPIYAVFGAINLALTLFIAGRGIIKEINKPTEEDK